jgi:uncharacterized membrane protein YfcA
LSHAGPAADEAAGDVLGRDRPIDQAREGIVRRRRKAEGTDREERGADGVGAASGFFGIGGGFLIVPGLVFATGMPMINAIGTSLFAVGAFGSA